MHTLRRRAGNSLQTLVIAAALTAGGCVQLTPAQRKVHVAPLAAVPDIVSAATAFRLSQGRWPQTNDELQAGFPRREQAPEYLSQIQSLSVIEQSSRSVLYRCQFRDGGTTELRVNLK